MKAHDEAACLLCGHEVVTVVRAWETAPALQMPEGDELQRRKASYHARPWSDEERRVFAEWKPGDPVPDKKEEPMDQGEMADKIRASIMDRPGSARFDIQTLRTQVQGRIDELSGLIQRERERSAERIAVANEELGQLRKALVALGVKPTPRAAKSEPREAGTANAVPS